MLNPNFSGGTDTMAVGAANQDITSWLAPDVTLAGDLPPDVLAAFLASQPFDAPRVPATMPSGFQPWRIPVNSKAPTKAAVDNLINAISPQKTSLEPARSTFVALQEWEGVVTDISPSTFTAILIDQTKQGTDEEAVFPIEEIARDDLSLFAEGAIFRWTIGFLKLQGGSKIRASQLVFRRLPQWTTSDMRQADKRASDLSKFFEEGRTADDLENATRKGG